MCHKYKIYPKIYGTSTFQQSENNQQRISVIFFFNKQTNVQRKSKVRKTIIYQVQVALKAYSADA